MSLAGGFGAVGVAVSVGVSLAFNEVAGDVAAFIRGSDGGVTATTGAVTVSAAQAGRPSTTLTGFSAAQLDDAARQNGDDAATPLVDEMAVDAAGDEILLANLAGALGIDGTIRVGIVDEGRIWEVVSDRGTRLITLDGGTLTATEATIDAITTAASLAAGIGAVGVAISGAGAAATNVVLTKVNAFIEASNVTSAADVALSASSEATIRATVAALSAVVAGGVVGVGLSIGAAVALNLIGHDIDGTRTPAEVQAYVEDASIDAGGDLTITADAAQAIDAIVLAASVAIAAGGVGVAASGSGVVADNRIAVLVKAFVDGTNGGGVHAAAITLEARDSSKIFAVAGAATVAFGFGVLAGVAVSIGVAVAHNEISSEVEASIRGAQTLVAENGDITLTAGEDAAIDALSAAASVAVGAGVSLFGAGISGAGAEATNVILTTTSAFVDGAAITSAGAVTLTATDSATIRALIVAASVAAGAGFVGIGAAVGLALARNLVGLRPGGDVPYDHISSSAASGLQTGDRVLIDSGVGAGDVFEYLGASLAGSGRPVAPGLPQQRQLAAREPRDRRERRARVPAGVQRQRAGGADVDGERVADDPGDRRDDVGRDLRRRGRRRPQRGRRGGGEPRRGRREGVHRRRRPGGDQRVADQPVGDRRRDHRGDHGRRLADRHRRDRRDRRRDRRSRRAQRDRQRRLRLHPRRRRARAVDERRDHADGDQRRDDRGDDLSGGAGRLGGRRSPAASPVPARAP